MQALQPTKVLSTLKAAGLVLSLTPNHGLKVTPASGLTDTLRAIIRECKPMLVEHLQRTAANDAAIVPTLSEADQELLIERMAVMQYDGGLPQVDAERLAVAHTHYLIHHWKCPTCKAAGQRRGKRCATGAALWIAYNNMAVQIDRQQRRQTKR